MTKLEINDLCKSYHGFTLGPINLQIEPGSVHALVGANGCGKTTLFRCIMGTVLKSQGSLKINGTMIDNKSGLWKQSLGYVGDYTPLFESWSGEKNLKTFSAYFDNWSDKTVQTLAAKFNLNLSKPVKTYSTGQRTIFALIYALAHGSTLLLLDEPTAGLDPLARDILMEVLYKKMHSEGISILYATHYISEIENLADQLILMKAGNIIKHEMKEDLIQDWRKITFRNSTELLQIPNQISKRVINRDHEIITNDYQKTLSYLEKSDAEYIQSSRLTIEQICVQFLKSNRKFNHD